MENINPLPAKPKAVPGANFARKAPAQPLDPKIASEIRIPPVYYWEDVVNGKSVLMTVAFRWKGRNYGMSYPIADGEDTNVIKMKMLRSKLGNVVKETCDVLVHHGDEVLDAHGNVDPRLVNDAEAKRYRYDQYWDRKVMAFNKLFRIRPITKKQAVRLGLLDAPKEPV